MNHFDDRASYFAMLREQGRYIDCLDNNNQQDVSLCTYGATMEPSRRVVLNSDVTQDI